MRQEKLLIPFRFVSNIMCGGASWEILSRKLAEPWVCLGGREDTDIICHWIFIHQMDEVLTPNQVLSFPKGQSATVSAAKQEREI